MIGITQSEYDEYIYKNKQSVRWLNARILFPDRGGISVESEDELIQFFKRRLPDGQWKVVTRKGGVAKLVPNLSDKSTTVWRRLEAERSKSRSMAEQKGVAPSYGPGSDWWPILEGLPKGERKRKANEWAEEGGWKNVEMDYGVRDTSDEEDDSDSDWDEYLERAQVVTKMEEAVPVTKEELAEFELREEEEEEQDEEQEEELEDAVPVTKEELAEFELREE